MVTVIVRCFRRKYTMKEKIAVIGLGYVGLPVAVGFSKHYDVVGYDIAEHRVERLKAGHDDTNEVSDADLQAANITFTTNPLDMKGCTFFVVTVPTPVDENRQPDLTPLDTACLTLGTVIDKGAVVVFESTVYPGVTEDFCGPILEEISGLKCGSDFTLGYSPERINPGDKVNRLETITKIVSGQDEQTLNRVADVYNSIITAGLHRAPSIKVAEAAKVIENTQRDLNIALMNEFSMIFDRVGIHTKDVLEAAGTKWNFLKFFPGLVGGHCIGVDPYYLTARAQTLGYYPQVILAGRRVNDSMGAYVAEKLVKKLISIATPVKGAKVGILGITFKENVPDLRNSRVPDIVDTLRSYGIAPLVSDCHAVPEHVKHEYGIDMADEAELTQVDALVLAVSHEDYIKQGTGLLTKHLKPGGVLVDIKSAFDPREIEKLGYAYWAL